MDCQELCPEGMEFITSTLYLDAQVRLTPLLEMGILGSWEHCRWFILIAVKMA